MLLKNLIKNCPSSLNNVKVKGIATDSKQIKKGYLFFAIKEANLHNFADDNTISDVAVSEAELIKMLESESCKAIDWLSQNSMIANPGKFHGIILKKNRSDTSGRQITIKGNVIETERDVVSLGITIDNKLSFKKHISSICKKSQWKAKRY